MRRRTLLVATALGAALASPAVFAAAAAPATLPPAATAPASTTTTTTTTTPTTTTPTTTTPTTTTPTTTTPTTPGGGVSIGLATGPYRLAGRGTVVQVTPTSAPPPVTDWKTGSVPNCTPGSLIRGVDTGGRRMVSFTFDDGPWPHHTQAIMDSFAARGLTATFFMIGQNLANYPDIGRSVVARGFAVGNHAMSHRYSTSVIAAEVAQMNSLIAVVLGVRTPYFRSPGLTEGSSIQWALANSGQCNLFTNVDLRDWITPRRTASQLCASFANSLGPGQIVLLHDGGSHSQTVAAVPCMLDVAAARGYEVVPLHELLAAGRPFERRGLATSPAVFE